MRIEKDVEATRWTMHYLDVRAPEKLGLAWHREWVTTQCAFRAVMKQF